MRSHYLVSYDISDPDRLRRVFQVVRNFGDRLQLSVFLCQLSLQEFVLLRERLRDRINQAEDQVLFVRLSAVEARDGLEERVEHLGRAPTLPDDQLLIF